MKDSTSRDGGDHHRKSKSKTKPRYKDEHDQYKYGKRDHGGEPIALFSGQFNLMTTTKGNKSKDIAERRRHKESRHRSRSKTESEPYKDGNSGSRGESRLTRGLLHAHNGSVGKARQSINRKDKKVTKIIEGEFTDDEENSQRIRKGRRPNIYSAPPSPVRASKHDRENNAHDFNNARQHQRPRAKNNRDPPKKPREPLSETSSSSDTSSDESSSSPDDRHPKIKEITPSKDLLEELNGARSTKRLLDNDDGNYQKPSLRVYYEDKRYQYPKRKEESARPPELPSGDFGLPINSGTRSGVRWIIEVGHKVTVRHEVWTPTEQPSSSKNQEFEPRSPESRRPKVNDGSSGPSSRDDCPPTTKRKEAETDTRRKPRPPGWWKSNYKKDALPYPRNPYYPELDDIPSVPRAQEYLPDYYGILGLTWSATPNDVRQAFKKKSISVHPDRAKDEDKMKANKEMAMVIEARDTLLDPDKRSIYDMKRQIRGDLRR